MASDVLMTSTGLPQAGGTARNPSMPGAARRIVSHTLTWLLSGWLLSSPASAHHSFANFDMTKTMALQGTVKEFQWTNPHCFVQLLVPGPTGDVEWSLEMNSPLAEYRSGWRPHSVKPGDKLTVMINPARNGSPSGRLDSATDANGQVLGKPPAQAPAKAAK